MSHIVSYIFKKRINSALTLSPGFISFTDFRGYQNLKKKKQNRYLPKNRFRIFVH